VCVCVCVRACVFVLWGGGGGMHLLICAQVQVCVQVDCFGSQEAKALLAASIARTLRLLPPPSCGREDGEAEEDMDGGARARQLPDATAMLDSKPLLDPKPGHQLSWDAEADATAQTLVALSACDHDSSLGDGGAVSQPVLLQLHVTPSLELALGGLRRKLRLPAGGGGGGGEGVGEETALRGRGKEGACAEGHVSPRWFHPHQVAFWRMLAGNFLKPYTPHPTPYTLHPTPYTLHPTLQSPILFGIT
jgi:hypothetical protein